MFVKVYGIHKKKCIIEQLMKMKMIIIDNKLTKNSSEDSTFL